MVLGELSFGRTDRPARLLRIAALVAPLPLDALGILLALVGTALASREPMAYVFFAVVLLLTSGHICLVAILAARALYVTRGRAEGIVGGLMAISLAGAIAVAHALVAIPVGVGSYRALRKHVAPMVREIVRTFENKSSAPRPSYAGFNGNLQVFTRPPGASILIDGNVKGQTPAKLHLPVDRLPLELSVRLSGYEPRQIVLTKTSDNVFNFVLEPMPLDLLPFPDPAPYPKSSDDKRELPPTGPKLRWRDLTGTHLVKFQTDSDDMAAKDYVQQWMTTGLTYVYSEDSKKWTTGPLVELWSCDLEKTWMEAHTGQWSIRDVDGDGAAEIFVVWWYGCAYESGPQGTLAATVTIPRDGTHYILSRDVRRGQQSWPATVGEEPPPAYLKVLRDLQSQHRQMAAEYMRGLEP